MTQSWHEKDLVSCQGHISNKSPIRIHGLGRQQSIIHTSKVRLRTLFSMLQRISKNLSTKPYFVLSSLLKMLPLFRRLTIWVASVSHRAQLTGVAPLGAASYILNQFSSQSFDGMARWAMHCLVTKRFRVWRLPMNHQFSPVENPLYGETCSLTLGRKAEWVYEKKMRSGEDYKWGTS